MSERLHDAFKELRAHEQANVPAFDELLSRMRPEAAPRKSAPKRRRRLALIAAAMAAALTAVFIWPRHITDDVAPLSITNWRAPTDVLLVTPGSDVLTELPVLNESVLNLQGSP